MTVALLAMITIFSAGGFVLARWHNWESAVTILAPMLKYSLYAVVFCCAYAGLVGVYHTILSVTGLDETRGRGEARMAAARAEAAERVDSPES